MSTFTLLAPTRHVSDRFEYSIHHLPPVARRHCCQVFPEFTIDEHTLVIPTVQRTVYDIIQYGAPVEREKNVCLERFYAWGHQVRDFILKSSTPTASYWCDLIDPCSGFPVVSRHGPTLYSEVDGLQTLLQYKQAKVGACHIVVHPQWESYMYPATVFTNAPLEVALQACQQARFDAKIRWNFDTQSCVDVDDVDEPLIADS
jgi:hypothetical protein